MLLMEEELSVEIAYVDCVQVDLKSETNQREACENL
jgi:hypothetical protein